MMSTTTTVGERVVAAIAAVALAAVAAALAFLFGSGFADGWEGLLNIILATGVSGPILAVAVAAAYNAAGREPGAAIRACGYSAGALWMFSVAGLFAFWGVAVVVTGPIDLVTAALVLATVALVGGCCATLGVAAAKEVAALIGSRR